MSTFAEPKFCKVHELERNKDTTTGLDLFCYDNLNVTQSSKLVVGLRLRILVDAMDEGMVVRDVAVLLHVELGGVGIVLVVRGRRVIVKRVSWRHRFAVTVLSLSQDEGAVSGKYHVGGNGRRRCCQ